MWVVRAVGGERVCLACAGGDGGGGVPPGDGKARAGTAELRAAAVTGRWEGAGPLASRHTPAATAPMAHTPAPSGITAREAQVVNLMIEGHSARAIGEALRISNETVRVHRRNIYEKLGISSQGELFRWFLATRG